MPFHRSTILIAACGFFCSSAFFGGCGDQPQTSAPKIPAPKIPAPAAESSATAAPTPSSATTAPTSPANSLTATAVKDEVKIMKEYWEGTRILKFSYEMRRGADGRWDRNGMSQAYYAGGKLEREGLYKDGKRVGMWTYYDEQGKVTRTENRGGAPGAPASSGAARSEQSDHAHDVPHDGPHDGHDH
jgi:hypothetical protein